MQLISYTVSALYVEAALVFFLFFFCINAVNIRCVLCFDDNIMNLMSAHAASSPLQRLPAAC